VIVEFEASGPTGIAAVCSDVPGRVRRILDAAGWTDRRLAGLPPLDPREGFTGVMILPPRRDQGREQSKSGKRGRR
jgi:hypothetical protein